ncbi:MAG: LL-diaminopimelate aminotransferase [Spirochaetia bacterium]
MITLNSNYDKLSASYLFSTIAEKLKTFQRENPDAEIIKLGIGDVTRALPQACVKALHEGVEEMASDQSFHGYGPEQGYAFLREVIASGDFGSRGVEIDPDEIFVSDGAKCDTANFQELLSTDITVAVPDPVYPVYVDTNVMAGRTGQWNGSRYDKLVYLESTEENNFVPYPPEQPADLIYLCFPNNPTGAVATKEQLKKWVDYAKKHKALILFDAAYVAFIRDESIPQSIYEIDGAKEVAVEFRSYSKTAGFTGTRCAYTVVPDECSVYTKDGKPRKLKDLWLRRQSTKFNGVSYPVQKAAAAVYTPEGMQQVRELTDYYLENAKIIRSGMEAMGFTCCGGIDSPYIWVKTGGNSWDFFDTLLEQAQVVTTPGSGFGSCGEGYIRISAFNHKEVVEEAMSRIVKVFS